MAGVLSLANGGDCFFQSRFQELGSGFFCFVISDLVGWCLRFGFCALRLDSFSRLTSLQNFGSGVFY